jgi:hypothetical protein
MSEYRRCTKRLLNEAALCFRLPNLYQELGILQDLTSQRVELEAMAAELRGMVMNLLAV